MKVFDFIVGFVGFACCVAYCSSGQWKQAVWPAAATVASIRLLGVR